MFSRQTITKDPVSVIPTVFDIVVLLGWFSYPLAINVTGNAAVLDSTAWHVLGSISITPSEPELLLIPWVAEAVGTVAGNNADLTDSLLLGEAYVNITLGISGFTGEDSELAPSWYIRQPYKNEKNFPYDKFEKIEPKIDCHHIDAPKNDPIPSDIPWGTLEDLSKAYSGNWNFIPKLDKELSAWYAELADKFSNDISQVYSYPDVKDVHEDIPWGIFDDLYGSDYSFGYYYPDTKDLNKIIPWNLFGNRFDYTIGMQYSHPPALDVFKTVFIGQHWFPRWCAHEFATAYGELLFNWDSVTNLAYQQYFDLTEHVINIQQKLYPPSQLEQLPLITDRASMFPGGSMFSGKPIGIGDSTLQMRSRTGGTLNIKTGYLEYPIYMKDWEENYAEVCYDGYRTGPTDSLEKVPYYKVVIPNIRSYYIVMNIVSLKLASDGTTVIPISSMSINTDMDSWCWSFRAELRRKEDLDLIRPSSGAPVEVIANINGNSWTFIVENYGESRSFGKQTFSISGRSPSSELAAPYSNTASLIQGSIRQAVQLADEAVASTAFTIDWQLTDWLVPANAYSVVDKTPMQQLLTIAAAAGGVVHSAQASNIISLVPWYPVSPWEWGAEIVDAAIPNFSSRSTQYQAQAQYNGAYVSGQNQGVTCLVKRTGTDGSSQPQMATDPLVTATEAGLQLGSKILSDSGNRSTESISIPLLDNPGLMTPGMLVDVIDKYETWRGQVVSVSVDAQRPKVSQSVSILRYHGT